MSKDKTLEDKTGTIIHACNCTNAFQDKLYGARLRVFNLCGGGRKKGRACCTSCGKYI